MRIVLVKFLYMYIGFWIVLGSQKDKKLLCFQNSTYNKIFIQYQHNATI